jgi:hypothetical protein
MAHACRVCSEHPHEHPGQVLFFMLLIDLRAANPIIIKNIEPITMFAIIRRPPSYIGLRTPTNAKL